MADEILINIRATDSFSGTLSNFGNILTGIKSAIDLAGDAFRVFGDFAMQGLDAIASYERMSITLQTLAASQLIMTDQAKDMNEALAMTSEIGEELLHWTQELAIKSPFTQEGVATAFQMAMAYGFNVEEAQRLTQAMLDFTAGTGQTEFAMERISRALGQISQTGKLTGQDMLQLTAVGVPVLQILADAFGVTTAEVVEMRTAGLIPAQEAIEALVGWMETNFAGAGERMTESWAGLTGTFQDLKQMGLREFFGGLFDVLQPLAVELSNWLQAEGLDKLREWGEMLGAFTQQIVDNLPAAIARLEELKAAFDTGGMTAVIQVALGDITLQDMVDFMDRLDAALAESINAGIASGQFRQSGDAFGNLIAGLFSSGMESQESEAIPAIGEAISQWFLGAMGVASWEEAKNTFIGILDQFLLQPAVNFVQQNFGEILLQGIIGALDAVTGGAFSRAVEIGANIVRGIVNGIYAYMVNLVNGILNTVDLIITTFKNLLGIASPSTVFMQIGRDIVLGLIMGIGTMAGSLIVTGLGIASTFVQTIGDKFSDLKDRVTTIFAEIKQAWDDEGLSGVFQYIGDQLNINLGGTTGTTGGMPGDTSHTPGGSTATSGCNVLNFYGPVYVGSVDELYDCPSPHPLMTASSQSLLTSGVG